MERKILNTYSNQEIDSILKALDDSILSIKECKEDKGVIECMLCSKRQSIHYIKQAKSILSGDSYLNDNDFCK